MGRPKQYDRNDLLDKAIGLFWRQGFSATTTAELVDALGVNRKSMYAEFGSKQGLFEAALERYDDQQLSMVLRHLEAEGAGRAAIERCFEGYARAGRGGMRGRGCLLANTAVERAALDPGARKHVAAYLDRFRRGFTGALQTAEAAGDLAPGQDIPALADFLTMSMVGVAALVRAEADPDRIAAACAVVPTALPRPAGPPA